MKKSKVLFVSMLGIAAVITLQNCGGGSGAGSSYNQVPASGCVAQASWFPHSQTPPPEEGANSPFNDPNTTSNCDFHQWSWQKFLYLTRTDNNGKAKFENLIQVNNQMIRQGSTLVITDSSQAGTSTILMDKTNRPVYYAVYMDPIMYGFASKYVKLFVANCDSSGLLSATKLKSFGYDTLTYPIGSYELKTAWVHTSSLGNDSVKFYNTTALLNGVAMRASLVGMHIVGRVVNHPELIWATYAHLNAAPVAKWSNKLPQDSIFDTSQVLSPDDYLFYTKNTSAGQCAITKPRETTGNFKGIYHLFDHGTQPLYGGITAAARAQDSSNLVNINNINAGVLDSLQKAGDLWQNYSYFGSLWIDPTTAPLQTGDNQIGNIYRANLRGSRALSNIAAETYIQYNVFNGKPVCPSNSFNCFGCHGTTVFVGKNFTQRNSILGLSHLFGNNLSDSLGGAKEQLRVLH